MADAPPEIFIWDRDARGRYPDSGRWKAEADELYRKRYVPAVELDRVTAELEKSRGRQVVLVAACLEARKLMTAHDWHLYDVGSPARAAMEKMDEALAQWTANEMKARTFDSLEDADEHAFPLHATIGVRSHSAGMLFYRLMEAENGERFWRLTEEQAT